MQIASYFVFLFLGILINSILTNKNGIPKFFTSMNYVLLCFGKSCESFTIAKPIFDFPNITLNLNSSNSLNSKTKSKVNGEIDNIILSKNDTLALLGSNESERALFLDIISKMKNIRLSKKNPSFSKIIDYFHKKLVDLEVGYNDGRFLNTLTVKQNIEFFNALSRKNNSNPKSWETIIKNFGLRMFKDKLPSELSLGNFKAFSLAIAFAGNPDVILLDNPTLGMDIDRRIKIWKTIVDYKKDKIVFLNTQNNEEANNIGNKFLIFEEEEESKESKFKIYNSHNLFQEKNLNSYTLTIYKKIMLDKHLIYKSRGDTFQNHQGHLNNKNGPGPILEGIKRIRKNENNSGKNEVYRNNNEQKYKRENSNENISECDEYPSIVFVREKESNKYENKQVYEEEKIKSLNSEERDEVNSNLNSSISRSNSNSKIKELDYSPNRDSSSNLSNGKKNHQEEFKQLNLEDEKRLKDSLVEFLWKYNEKFNGSQITFYHFELSPLFIKFEINISRLLSALKDEKFFQKLEIQLNQFGINLYEFSKQSLEEFMLKTNSFKKRNKKYIDTIAAYNPKEIDVNNLSRFDKEEKEGNQKQENEREETRNKNSNDKKKEKQKQKQKQKKGCCSRWIIRFLLLIWEMIKKRFRYLLVNLFNFVAIIIFLILMMLFICLITRTVKFQYSAAIPQINYNYLPYSNQFFLDTADPKYNIPNNVSVIQLYNDFYNFLSTMSNFQYTKKPDSPLINPFDRLKDIHSFIYSESKNINNFPIGSLQTWRLIEFYPNQKYSYTGSTFVSLINLSFPQSLGIITTHLSDSIVRFATGNKFGVSFTNYPQPISSYTQRMMKQKLSLIPIQFLILSLSIVNYLIINSVFYELKTGLAKIQKLILGDFLFFTPNILLDIIESFIIGIIFIAIQEGLQFKIKYSWILLFVFAFAIIPFNYFCMVFWIKWIPSDKSHHYILILNIITGNLMPSVIQVLSRFDEISSFLYIVEKIFQFIFPIFALHQGLFNSISNKSKLFYPENPQIDLDLKVMFSIIGMVSSFALYICLIIIIEFIISRWSIKNKFQRIIQSNEFQNLHFNKCEEVENNSDNLNLNNKDQKSRNKLSLIGPSGSGKSNILEIITEVDHLSILEYLERVFGIEKYGEKIFENVLDIGYCPAYLSFFPFMTVRENLEFYYNLKIIYNPNSTFSTVDEILHNFKIAKGEEEKLSICLSKGSQKLLKLAISFIGRPDLVLIDEPTSELNSKLKISILKLINGTKNKLENVFLILCSHDFNELLTLTNCFQFVKNERFSKVSSLHHIIKCGSKIKFHFKYIIKENEKVESNENDENNENSNVYNGTDFNFKDQLNELINNTLSKNIKFYDESNKNDVLKLLNMHLSQLNSDQFDNNINIQRPFYSMKNGFEYLKDFWDKCLFNYQQQNNINYFEVKVVNIRNSPCNIYEKLLNLHREKKIELLFIKPYISDFLYDWIRKEMRKKYSYTN